MGLEDIKEIRESNNQEEVNGLLGQGNWRLIDAKVEKVRVPVGKEKVGVDAVANWLGEQHWDRFEVKYEERLATQYIIGRYK